MICEKNTERRSATGEVDQGLGESGKETKGGRVIPPFLTVFGTKTTI